VPQYSHLDYQLGAIPNAPEGIQQVDECDIVWFATKPWLCANDRNGKYIFDKAGEYILHVKITGDAPTAPVELKFNWTGRASSSSMELINVTQKDLTSINKSVTFIT
jgi:hypothetical protein